MATTEEQLKKLKDEIPFKWREQSVNQYGATCVAYIDARDLFDKLDDVCGAGNWQSDFKLIDGSLYGGIGINIEGIGWIWKWDVGSESNVEKVKGESSDALKRAGVQWGIGRFLYSLGIVKLKVKEHSGKFKPADDSENIIWDKEKLTEVCNAAIKEGKLDRTRLGNAPKTSKTTTPPSVPQVTNWLNKGTDEFAKVEAALKSGNFTIEDVKKKYTLSKAVETELKGLVK